ncbi:MAG: choice-of-anchor L domain-containing protein [Bacteroidota bacterium]
MKKILLLLLFINSAVFSQGITVNSGFSDIDLAYAFLLNNNSCVQLSNVQSQGSCGLAHFSSSNPNFPFQSGVMIKSGNASLSGGQYTGSNPTSTCSNMGDSQLAAISQANGNSGSINDVSFLKFDFVSSLSQISFDFIFASNEYGPYQCSFSDVFAFILTDLTTGQSINLAVIPGTSTPVSVTTIRDVLYNSGCASANPQLFDKYNVGSAATSTMNMNGHTVPMIASAAITPNNPYSIKLVVGDYADTAFDSAVFIKANSFNLGNTVNLACNPDKIKMVSFVDTNTNGVKDVGELDFNLGNFKHQLNNATTPTHVISQNGVGYLFSLNYADTHDLSYQINPEYASYYTCSTSYNDVTINQGSNETTYYFPVINTTPYADVEVVVVPNNNPNPGFTYNNTVVYKNKGVLPTSGTLTFNHSSNVSLLSNSEPSSVSTTNGFTLDYTNLLPFETRTIDLSFSVPTIPTINLGDIVQSTSSITSTITDAITANNTYELNNIVTGSYDPNDINEAHGNEILFSDFGTDDYLYYTIRFQNTGTGSANFISIVDYLPIELDGNTLVMLQSSHNYNLTRKANGELKWFFENINLVPSSVNNEASQGYVTFKVKPTPDYSVGTLIENTAEIYFDYNPAITTNTFETLFVNALSSESHTLQNFAIYPNPANNFITIQNKDNAIISKVNLTDILGKNIKTSTYNSSEVSMDISNLNSGIYFVEIYSNEVKTTKKIIKR